MKDDFMTVKRNKPVEKDNNVYSLLYSETFLLNEVNKYSR